MSRQKTDVSFKENTRLGVIVLIVCVLVSIFVLGPVKLSGARREAETSLPSSSTECCFKPYSFAK